MHGAEGTVVKVGTRIFLDDGLIELSVVSIGADQLVCTVASCMCAMCGWLW